MPPTVLGIGFEHRDRDAVLAQHVTSRQSGGACADDADRWAVSSSPCHETPQHVIFVGELEAPVAT